MPRMILIDGHAVAYRQFFALPVESMSTRAGEPTNAVFGFTRILLDILQKDRPDYLAVSFDMGLSGRDVLFGEYKGTREKMPDELRSQLERIDEVVRAFNIPVLTLDGYEADDVIGTATRQAEAQDVASRIITGDRDLLQLLSGHVTVQLPSRGGPDEIWDVSKFIEKYGLQPDQLVDLKALMGDSSDNIPGVRGIGEKGATNLLQTYGSLDAIYAAVDEIKGALGKKLVEGREMAYVSQRLARIQRDIPITLNLNQCVAHDYDASVVLSVFESLNFRSLRDRLIKISTPTQQPLFGDMQPMAVVEEAPVAPDFDPPARASDVVETVVVRSEAALANMIEDLRAQGEIAVDTETTSLDAMIAELVGISLSGDGKRAYYIPVGHTGTPQLPLETVVRALKPVLEDSHVPKFMHNVTYDLVVLRRHGIDVRPIAMDTMVAEWLLNPISRNLGLKDLTFARLRDDNNRPIFMTPISDLIGTGKKAIPFSEVDVEQAAPYAAADAAMTFRLKQQLSREIEQNGLTEVHETLELPLLPVVVSMEQAGVVLDTGFLAQMSEHLGEQLVGLEQHIYELAGTTLNLNSPQQLSDLLFGKLGLPTKGIGRTSLGYTTNAAVLDELRDAHPVVGAILEYRELSKLKGTYVDALPALINPYTGRVHTSYNLTGTSTGRLSSSNPNLQNIPIRTEVGREVRRAFIAPEGHVLLSVDYSQIELRVLAHISGDETLKQAFYDGQDIHKATAAAVNGIPLEDVTYEQRSFAKRVNFGLIYGMGAFRLARDSGLTLAEAEDFIRRYFARLPRVQEYIQSAKERARSPEGLKTLAGRSRTFPALHNPRASRQMVQAEERAAINLPIQGSAADIINLAMIQLHRALAAERLRSVMILQVHDELVLEVPEDELGRVKPLVINTMESSYPLDPPLKANAEVGPNWRDME
ncbi:MAG: DNA polymerase I [Chloroflexota bacterium]|nr:MAG: DNA polymerase I [Chloroflexi bacterium OLB13]MEB2366477.1 DNA polymerase I [Chloroflexota bacterium]GIK27389.1 MAG: DNA polymerase I [Chloroflexota bacterium]